MKNDVRGILILLAAGMLTLGISFCTAADNRGQNARPDRPGPEDRSPRGGFRDRREPGEEEIQRALNQLGEKNPGKMEDLQKLQRSDRDKFMAELRPILAIQRIDADNAEYLKWLQENYPEDANNLTDVRDKKPDWYPKMLEFSKRRYETIFKTEKENPELADILKSELQIRDKQNQLLGKIKAATDENEKKMLTEDLRVALSDGYDLIVRRKQLEYDQLLKKLEQLKEEIAKSKENVENWKDQAVKSERVTSYLNELLKFRRFRWD